MASSPVLVGAGTAAFETTPGLAFTPSLPLGWARRDILLLLFTHTANGPLSPPSGWTQLAAQDNTSGQRTELWWKRATPSETPPSLVLASNAVTTVRGARIYAIRGCPPDDTPFDRVTITTNAASATIDVPAVTSTRLAELALALVAYASNPLTATTLVGWTQPALAVQGYGTDVWSGSYTVDSTDPDVPSGGTAGPGAMLLHQYRPLGNPLTVPSTSTTVSEGTFSPAVSTVITLTLASLPSASMRVRARLRGLAHRGGPALARAAVRVLSVGRKETEQPSRTLADVRARAQTLKVGLTSLVGQARSWATSAVVKRGRAMAALGVRSASIVVSMRTPDLSSPTAGRVRSRGTSTYVSALSPGPLPVKPPIPRDLGEIYRGDTVKLPVWVAQARNGLPIDLTGATLRFTAKLDLTDADADPPTINASSEDGSIAIADPPTNGRYRVTIPSTETLGLEIDGSFTFDVQLTRPGDASVVHTIEYGRLLVNRDVTRTSA